MPTTLQAIRLTPFDLSNQYSENLLPYTLSFNDGTATPSVSSGTGTAQLSTIQPFDGNNCLKLTNGAPASNLVANVTGSLQIFQADVEGNYPFQFSVRNPSENGVPATGRITVFVNTVASYYIEFDTQDIYDDWITFYNTIPLPFSSAVTFTYTYFGNASVSAFTIIYLDGLKLELNNRVLSSPTTYTPPNGVLKVVDSLNFPSTLAGDMSELTVIFPAAVAGEAVLTGVPVNNIAAGGVYDAYVNAAGTIKARFWNNTASTIDPPLGNFTFTIIK